MRTSARIAATAAIAMTASMYLVLLITKHFSALPEDLLAPIVGGFLVGLGSYLGSRWAPVGQRTARLSHVLGVFFFGLGIVLTFPHKTHAIKMDMPATAGSSSSIEVFVDVALAPIAASAVVLVSMLLTRGVAVLCKPKSQYDT
jgi:hypothetical protein